VAMWIFHAKTASPATHWDCLGGLGVTGVNLPSSVAKQMCSYLHNTHVV
jgi:hypothetical protein